MSLPNKNRGVVLIERGQIAIKDQELSKWNDDQVLIKVKAVAINPADWKGIESFLRIGANVGHDFSGDIVAIGDQVQSKGEWKVGDTVAGCISGGTITLNDGTFQEYIVAFPELIWKKPAYLPYEDAAAMGVALSTAVQAIHIRLGIPYDPITTPEPFLVWGGSSGVGMYAIKLASLAGYKVVTIASRHNWDLVKSLGASEVFDYKDPEVVTCVKEWVERQGSGPLTKALDTISEKESIVNVIEIMDKGGELVTIVTPPRDLDTKGVHLHHILLFNALKRGTGEFEKLVDWYLRLPLYIESNRLGQGQVPLKIFSGGIEDIPVAIDYVRQGRNSGHKVVVLFN